MTSHAKELLEHAAKVVRAEPTRRPNKAALRRAVSTAYYALFHLLSESVGALVAQDRRRDLAKHFGRALDHGEMKKACEKIRALSMATGNGSQPKVPPVLRHVFDPPNRLPNADLKNVAEAFISLQQARHQADYDVARSFSQTEAFDLITIARNSFASWDRVRNTSQGHAFSAFLLLYADGRE